MGSALPTPLFCKGGCRWGNGSLSGCVLRRRGGGAASAAGVHWNGIEWFTDWSPLFLWGHQTHFLASVVSSPRISAVEKSWPAPVQWVDQSWLDLHIKPTDPVYPIKERETPELASWEFLIDALCHPSPHSGLIEKLFSSSFTFYFSLLFFIFCLVNGRSVQKSEASKMAYSKQAPEKRRKKNGMFTRPWALSIFWMTE
jgi:hypothetical protein